VQSGRVIIVGGGAAGFFAAITCAQANPDLEVVLLEKTARFLEKVRISGGGRCNVTHACFDTREMATRYPRGEKALLSPFTRFQASDAVAWFESRGVKLKTESDGRMFPVTDSSQTIMDCLMDSAREAGVDLRLNSGVNSIAKKPDGSFEVSSTTPLTADRVLLATGGCRSAALGELAVSLGHTLQPPVPSLFTFHIKSPLLADLAGVSVDSAEVSVADEQLRERGPLLITHWGLSGPAILRLSAWGARALHRLDYKFPLRVNWLAHLSVEEMSSRLARYRAENPARQMVNTAFPPLPSRLWQQLVATSGIAPDTRWSALSRAAQHRLVEQMTRTEFQVTGKSLNKDEFVTCGGVSLNEVNFKTMESRICSGLHFAGELLDIDGITGGFNFQAAWTTGWLAGKAMAEGT
jgi:predicted Rossmann fold flavoprotein